MVYRFCETPMNLIRSELRLWMPVFNCPRKNISRKEISVLLFSREDATLREIASYLSIDISDERNRGVWLDARKIYAIDIKKKEVARVFSSESEARSTFFISRGGVRKGEESYMDYIIKSQLAFSLDGKYIVLSRTENFKGEIKPIIAHCLNLPRFRKFLFDIGYTFVSCKTDLQDICRYFNFPYGTSLKTIMEHFQLPWGKKGGRRVWGKKILVYIVSPYEISNAMSIRSAAKELNITTRNVCDYIKREVVFRYQTNKRDSFLIYS